MANRKNTFLLKRSNIIGKIPSSGDLLLGELGLNVADVILYASGTTSNSILPIGWDRVARTGDTMTGNLYAPSVSASTFGVGNYIDFNTGNTVPTNISGRLFYNNIEESLSYYPNSTQNVVINLGQQLYSRVNNASGVIIPKGSVVAAITASGGTPSVTLAISSGNTGNNIIGLAASDIPIGSQGLVITQGLLSGLTINTFNVGQNIYLSDITPGGYIGDSSNLALLSRINLVGYITETGTTTGKIYVKIVNENSEESLTIKQKNLLSYNSLSTGIYLFGGITTASTTTINISALSGWIVNNAGPYALNPNVINVQYSGQTGLSITNIATQSSTHILITSASTIIQQFNYPTPNQRRDNIFLGTVVHSNNLSIEFIFNSPDIDISPISQTRDLWQPIGLINSGIIASSNGANLNFNTSAGVLYGTGINFVNDYLNPNSINISGKVPVSFSYRTQSGGTTGNVILIDPTKYDVGGVITNVGGGANSCTNQRIYMFQNGQIRVQYGQTVYNSLASAVAGIDTETFVRSPLIGENTILIGVISTIKTATALNDLVQANFRFTSKFGETGGGSAGLSTTTLQQAYNNSVNPEILTNSTLGGLNIKNGTGNSDNVSNLFEGVNSSDTTTSFIRADGTISASTISANTATIGTNTTQLATTAFVLANSDGYSSVNASSNVATTSNIDVVVTGMTIAPGAGSYIVTFNSQYSIASGNVTAQASSALTTAYNTLMSVSATNTTHLAVFGGETLTAGTYTIATAGSLAGTLILDAQGDSNAVFIFRFGAAFNSAASSTVTLINGASACNVFWVAQGAIGLGASTTMKGTLLSNGGAVSLGASCSVIGRLFTTGGAIGIDSSTITIPTSCTYLNLGILSSFAIFTSIGNVTNAGVSTITGDIGTNSGTVTGFGTAVVNGTIYLPGVDNNALATFSVYQNGILVANSSRTRTLNINTVDIALQAIATVSNGQAIDIRCNVDAGTVSFTNRILTLKKIR